MFSKLSKLLALKSADKLLESRAKITEAIERETAKLLRLVTERVEVDRGVVAADTSAALGEQADPAGARQKAAAVMTSIERQGSILAGLRARLATQAPELEGQIRGIQSALPGHIDGLKQDFAADWQKGIQAFGVLIGKRAALEALIGKLDLPEPKPVVCDLEAAAAPWRCIEELRAGIEEIAAWGRSAAAPQVDSMMPTGGTRPFDPRSIYVLSRDTDSLKAGTPVMAPVFAPGTLQHLVNIDYARALNDSDWETNLEAGNQFARVLNSEAQSETNRAMVEQEAAAHRDYLAKTPAWQRPFSLEDDPEYQRQREAAKNRAPVSDPNPPHVATIS
jgi:hypothetical protein